MVYEAQYYSDVFYVTLIISIDDENKKKKRMNTRMKGNYFLYSFDVKSSNVHIK